MKFSVSSAFLVAALAFSASIHAEEARQKPAFNPPSLLHEWTSWVSLGDPVEDCPFIYNELESAFCLGSQALQIEAGDADGRFSAEWTNFGEARDVVLPGDEEHWPLDVKINGKPANVMQKGELAVIRVEGKGQYQITGRFAWDSLPDSLAVPAGGGMISLSVGGKSIKRVLVEDGHVSLNETASEDATGDDVQDSVDAAVFRKITTSIPLKIDSLLQLSVSGKAREFVLPDFSLEGFQVLDIESDLPYKMNEQGAITLQLTPGEHVVHIYSIAHNPVMDVKRRSLPYPFDGDELWTIQNDDSGRMLSVKDSYPVDSSRTRLPEEWKRFSAYRIDNESQGIHFVPVSQDELSSAHSNLSLRRELWLDFDGNGVTAQDRIAGQSIDRWRMNSSAAMFPGKVMINGEPQLLTQDGANSGKGFEISKGNVDVLVNSRLNNFSGDFNVSGWQDSFNSVSMRWHLPVGWKAIHASGADSISSTWIQEWTLVDIFMIVVIAVAVAKLWGLGWGLTSFAANGLVWHEVDAPHELWLVLVGISALFSYIPKEKAKYIKLLSTARIMALLALWIPLSGFTLDHIRYAVYPQLEAQYESVDGAFAGKPDIQRARPKKVVDSARALAGAGGAEQMKEEMFENGIMPSVAPMESIVMDSAAPSSITVEKGVVLKRNKKLTSYDVFADKDKNANIQTGPGIPNWSGSVVSLGWNGTVDPEQTAKILALSPNQMRVVHIMQALLLLILSIKMSQFKFCLPTNLPKWAALTLALFVANAEAADIPTQDMLNAYHEKLLTAKKLGNRYDCLPQCAQVERSEIQVKNELIVWDMTIHAQERVAVPLPKSSNFDFDKVIVDDSSRSVFFSNDEWLYVFLDKGVHKVQASGSLDSRNEVSWNMPMAMHHLSFKSGSDWQIEGIHEDGLADSQLMLVRSVKKQVTESFQQAFEAKPMLRVERSFELGLDWHLHTRIHRESSANTAIVVDIPLLDNEQVVSQGFHFKDKEGKQWISVSLSPNESEIEWESTVVKTDSIVMQAMAAEQWHEVWSIRFNPLWHIEYEDNGAYQAVDADWYPQWRPYPGEKVVVKISKPKAIDGETLTLSQAELNVSQNGRNMNGELRIVAQSSKGGDHRIQLPANAKVLDIEVNGQKKPVHQVSKEVGQPVDLVLPIVAGSQNFKVNFTLPHEGGFSWTMPKIDFNAVLTNFTSKASLGDQRWVLYVSGPMLGPVVLFWGMVFGLILISYGLSKVPLMPFRWHEWFLLLIGMTQNSLDGMFVVVAVFAAVGLRGSRFWIFENRIAFNALQVVLILAVFLAGICFVDNIGQGLLGSPQMNISGFNSSNYIMSWYQDRVNRIPENIYIFTAHIYVYRIIMLLWSLWVANILIKNVRWIASCMTNRSFWLNSAKIVSNSESSGNPDLKITFNK